MLAFCPCSSRSYFLFKKMFCQKPSYFLKGFNHGFRSKAAQFLASQNLPHRLTSFSFAEWLSVVLAFAQSQSLLWTWRTAQRPYRPLFLKKEQSKKRQQEVVARMVGSESRPMSLTTGLRIPQGLEPDAGSRVWPPPHATPFGCVSSSSQMISFLSASAGYF